MQLTADCAALKADSRAYNTGSLQPIIKMFVAIRTRTFYSLRMDLFPSTPGRQPKCLGRELELVFVVYNARTASVQKHLSTTKTGRMRVIASLNLLGVTTVE